MMDTPVTAVVPSVEANLARIMWVWGFAYLNLVSVEVIWQAALDMGDFTLCNIPSRESFARNDDSDIQLKGAMKVIQLFTGLSLCRLYRLYRPINGWWCADWWNYGGVSPWKTLWDRLLTNACLGRLTITKRRIRYPLNIKSFPVSEICSLVGFQVLLI